MADLSVFDKVRVLIYRIHEKGLEVFLIKPKLVEDEIAWKIPHSQLSYAKDGQSDSSMIHLDPVTDEFGEEHYTVALEGDWHDIPSIRGMIKSDINRLKSKINEVLPDLENGTYVAAQEVVKKVLPHEYAAVKELKEILVDRNTVGNI